MCIPALTLYSRNVDHRHDSSARGCVISNTKYICLALRHQLTRSLGAVVACLLVSQPGFADQAAASKPQGENTTDVLRHRIDAGAVFLDSISADSINGIFGYTYNLTSKSNINLSVPYLDPDTGTSSNSGFGDIVMSYSYVPSSTISAHPWVPRTIGTGIALLAPTGDAKEGRSIDSWVVAPYIGLVVPLAKRVFIAPQAGYVHSLDQTVSGTDLRLAFAQIGLGFVTLNGFWTSYFPQFVRDLESDEWVINHRFSIGKMVSQKFGLSFEYTLVERFIFGSNLPTEVGFDKQIEFNMHFNF